MVLGNYGAVAGLLWISGDFPVLSATALICFLALHMSLQHELLHGHPTPWQRVNDALGWLPLTLVVPYTVFKQSHRQHHQDEFLTLPGIDPESYFYSLEQWQQKSAARRLLCRANMTLAGRLLLNPLRSIAGMASLCVRQLVGGSSAQRMTWLVHIAAVFLLLWCISRIMQVPAWQYLACVYGAHSLISLRAFFEHRLADTPDHRIVVVESCRFFQLLFLNNNFHATHHRYPGLPWYRIQQQFHLDGGEVLQRNGQFHYQGYHDWLRYLFHQVADPVIPAQPR